MTSPLETFEKDNSKRWDILTDIPKWEFESIFLWVLNMVTVDTIGTYNRHVRKLNGGRISTIQRVYRVLFDEDFEISTESLDTFRRSFRALMEDDPFKAMMVIELFIKYLKLEGSSSVEFGGRYMQASAILALLEQSLSNGSKWSVQSGASTKNGLLERVSDELTEMAKSVNNDDLREAWDAAFGAYPDPDIAIEKSQAAIEYLASHKGLTKGNQKYGTLIAELRKQLSEGYGSVATEEFKLSNVLAGEKSNEPNYNDLYIEWFWKGLNLIQKSNPSRHKSLETKDFRVSIDASRQAVMIATLLAQLIQSEYIRKVKK